MSVRIKYGIVIPALLSMAAEVPADRLEPVVSTFNMQQVNNVSGNDLCINLSKCVFAGSEFDVTVTDQDSLIAVVFPDRRYQFAVTGDTVLMTCEETRDIIMRFPAGVALNINGSDSFHRRQVQGYGRYRQMYNLIGEQSVTVRPPKATDLITVEGDTISDVRYDHFIRSSRFAICNDTAATLKTIPDSLILTSTTETSLISMYDEAFPRVIKRVTTLSGRNKSITDSATYILSSYPQKLPADKQKARPQKYTQPIQPDGNSSISVAPNGESIVIQPTDNDGELSVVINDISGRTFLSEKVPAKDQSTVDISFLAKGEYLVQLLNNGQITGVVKFIKQ